MQLAAFPLRDLRNLRENNTQEYPSYIAQTKPQYLPQISLIYADKTTITIPDETHIFLKVIHFSVYGFADIICIEIHQYT